ncbi:hypothetical protein [Consotaella salsifontis]|uniref:Head-tail joining protein n=1 Tax=Consotaella salsifontis TaxID=1365950 RepID=A0A1T4SJF0_9HYPH|nr:hypothetical protein [Consotaella salsifontis]SKA28424.1 hypothetical protein SAMN05428963_11179 [Consotaella salsifontis]
MSSILEGELAELVTDALTDANVPRDIVVTRTLPGNPYDPDGGSGGTADYVGKGWVENYADADRDGALIGISDVRVIILTTTIAIAPSEADSVTVGGETYQVINAARDASGALYELQARR